MDESPPETLSPQDLEEAGVMGASGRASGKCLSQGSWLGGSQRWTQNPRRAQLHCVLLHDLWFGSVFFGSHIKLLFTRGGLGSHIRTIHSDTRIGESDEKELAPCHGRFSFLPQPKPDPLTSELNMGTYLTTPGTFFLFPNGLCPSNEWRQCVAWFYPSPRVNGLAL